MPLRKQEEADLVTKADSRWYTAVLVLEGAVNGQAQAEPEIQFRLLEARDHEEAYERALEIGAQAEHSYRNSDNHEVAWSFRGLADLTEVVDGAPRHGAEVYSTRSRLPIAELVKPRKKLTSYWLEANKGKTARQILDGE